MPGIERCDRLIGKQDRYIARQSACNMDARKLTSRQGCDGSVNKMVYLAVFNGLVNGGGISICHPPWNCAMWEATERDSVLHADGPRDRWGLGEPTDQLCPLSRFQCCQVSAID
jgi:hypothetical protein